MTDMLEYAAREAMKQSLIEIFSHNNVELTQDDLDYGFEKSMALVLDGLDLGVDMENYDPFHALLIREATCAMIMAKKLGEKLEEYED